MSLAKLVFPELHFAELWSILCFLSHEDMYRLGCTCRSAFITFMRERTLRAGWRDRSRDNNSSNSSSSDRTRTHTPRVNLIDDSRFLSKHSPHEKVLLVSYPRSGNSYVRKLLETRSGIATGSDSRPNRPLTSSLIRFGYKGEGITDQSVWIVKSHFPERMGYIHVSVSRVILVVRNPFDALESYFHMAMTNTHDKMLSAEAFASLNDLWKDFLPNEAKVWKDFHEYWLRKKAMIPMLVVRYEDLLANEKLWSDKIFDFIAQSPSAPAGHQRFLPKPQNEEASLGLGYKPKQNRKVGKSLAKMTYSMAKDVIARSEPLLSSFGYELTETQSTSPSPDIIADDFLSININSDVESLNECGLRLDGELRPVVANGGQDIRLPDDPFGRKVMFTRQKYTNGDKQPLATM